MTRVDFYSNVTNKAAFLAELVQGALNKRRQVTIFADNAQNAAELSAHLWQQPANSFLPNVLADDVNASQTAVVLNWQESQLTQDDMLINLTQIQPLFFSRFTQLVEMVGQEEQDKAAGRLRFKFYRDRGYEIKHVDYANSKV